MCWLAGCPSTFENPVFSSVSTGPARWLGEDRDRTRQAAHDTSLQEQHIQWPDMIRAKDSGSGEKAAGDTHVVKEFVNKPMQKLLDIVILSCENDSEHIQFVNEFDDKSMQKFLTIVRLPT